MTQQSIEEQGAKPTMCPTHPEAVLERKGRANWVCPVDNQNMMLELVYMYQATHPEEAQGGADSHE